MQSLGSHGCRCVEKAAVRGKHSWNTCSHAADIESQGSYLWVVHVQQIVTGREPTQPGSPTEHAVPDKGQCHHCHVSLLSLAAGQATRNVDDIRLHSGLPAEMGQIRNDFLNAPDRRGKYGGDMQQPHLSAQPSMPTIFSPPERSLA
jgi:hypothetical protein